MKAIDYDSPLGRLKTSFLEVRLFSGLPARVFGCIVFVHQNSGKFDPRGLRCIVVEYSERVSVLPSSFTKVFCFG